MKETLNYKLKKIELADSPPDITVHSENFEIIDAELKRQDDARKSHEADLSSQELNKGASLIGIHDANNLFTSTNVEGALNELFTNVSDGKILIGGAITGVDGNIIIPADATFQDLATAISQISTGKKWASGIMTPTKEEVYTLKDKTTMNFYSAVVSGLDFKPSGIILDASSGNSLTFYYNNDFIGDVGILVGRAMAYQSAHGIVVKKDSPVYIDSGGFKLPAPNPSPVPTNWIAFE